MTAPSSTDAPPTAAAYVYGVVAASSVPSVDLDGVADAPVRAVASGEVAALVSSLPPGQLRVRRRDLMSHLRVLEEAFAESTVVPCAFGMLLASEDAVRHEFLEPRREELLDLLRRLDGFVQLNVRVSYDEDVVLREIVEGDAAIAQLREQTRELGDAGYHLRIRLGELVAAAHAQRRERDGRALLERLGAKAADVAVDEPGAELALKASFLVARDRVKAFDRELENVAREQAPRLLIDTVGPLPPTAFAALEREAWGS
jgi:hypothetical protein